MGQRIFFSVGEPSGDQHAARLCRALRALDPECQLRGFGGPRMAAAGCQLDHDLTTLAVMGIVEVLPKLREFRQLAAQAEECFRRGEVDQVVMVDFPGFNWHIAKRARRAGLPVTYYCPPQLWAWAPWRVRKLRRTVDRVLCVLPFEYQWYRERGVEAQYVGHPFFDSVTDQTLDRDLITDCQNVRDSGHPLVAVLPGSRDHEVQNNWPQLIQIIRRISAQHPSARFRVAAYKPEHAELCRRWWNAAIGGPTTSVEFYSGRTSELIAAADCAVMVSGSVSLEFLARGTPAVVIYHMGRVLYTLGRMLVRVRSITLPNLMAERLLMPEFISVGSETNCIEGACGVLDQWLSQPAALAAARRELQSAAQKLAQPGATAAAARWVMSAGANRGAVDHVVPRRSDGRAA
jgi:lipid-A-disaccharide synthase